MSDIEFSNPSKLFAVQATFFPETASGPRNAMYKTSVWSCPLLPGILLPKQAVAREMLASPTRGGPSLPFVSAHIPYNYKYQQVDLPDETLAYELISIITTYHRHNAQLLYTIFPRIKCR